MEGQRIFVKRVREEVNENQGQNHARGQVVGHSVFEGRFCKKGNVAIERAWWSQRAGRGEVEPVQAGGATLPRGRRSNLGAGPPARRVRRARGSSGCRCGRIGRIGAGWTVVAAGATMTSGRSWKELWSNADGFLHFSHEKNDLLSSPHELGGARWLLHHRRVCWEAPDILCLSS